MAQSVKPADLGVAVGQVFLGKYRVDAILGHGGMGVVAECTHLALNERVAIKMLRQDVLLDGDAVSRFDREAKAAAKLKSEHVARVHDVGVFENGVPYMAMEFLEGHDLGQLLEQRGTLAAPWAVELMIQTCEALAEAHSLGIVHRDIKPSNLFVTWRPDGSAIVKVLDFGISKSPTGTDLRLTQTQSLLGTPAYMSPEQMRSARLVDSRTDIWSLGTVLYELLEGRKPFEAESFSEMCVKVAVDPPAPMVKAPPELHPIVLRCLQKAPEQRYASMADLAYDLVPFAQDPHQAAVLVERMDRMLRRSGDFSNEPKSSPRISRVPTPVPVATPHTVGVMDITRDDSVPFPRTEGGTPARRRGWVIALSAFVVLVTAGAVGLSLSGTPARPARAPRAMPHEHEPVPPMPAQVTKQDVAPAPAPAPVPAPRPAPAEPTATPVPTAAKAEPKHAATAHHGTPRTVKATAHALVTHKAEESGKPATPPPAPKCNPWDDIHGTQCRQDPHP